MNNISPDDLKMLAKSAGKMNVHVKNNAVLHELPTCSPSPRCFREYNPLTNNDQNRELEIMLLDNGWSVHGGIKDYRVEKGISYKCVIHRGKTINEAVVNAAIEYIKRGEG